MTGELGASNWVPASSERVSLRLMITDLAFKVRSLLSYEAVGEPRNESAPGTAETAETPARTDTGSQGLALLHVRNIRRNGRLDYPARHNINNPHGIAWLQGAVRHGSLVQCFVSKGRHVHQNSDASDVHFDCKR